MSEEGRTAVGEGSEGLDEGRRGTPEPQRSAQVGGPARSALVRRERSRDGSREGESGRRRDWRVVPSRRTSLGGRDRSLECGRGVVGRVTDHPYVVCRRLTQSSFNQEVVVRGVQEGPRILDVWGRGTGSGSALQDTHRGPWTHVGHTTTRPRTRGLCRVVSGMGPDGSPE